MSTQQGISSERIAELKKNGYDVHCIYDGDPSLYGWLNLVSGATQRDHKERQPYRPTKAQAWADCDAYDSGVIPSQPEPDWE